MKKHNISITYCVPWNYHPQASRAAADILENYQHIVESLTLKTGAAGVFDVVVDGETIYSKHETDRHAHEVEVLELFTALVGPDMPRYGDQ